MTSLNAKIPASHQKDGTEFLSIEFDNDTDGWYLYGHKTLAEAPTFDFWNMTQEDAIELAARDWGVSDSDWQGGQGGEEEGTSNAPTLDVNGTALKDGDTVTLIKDLPVKGAGVTIKRGTAVRNISLTNNPEEIDCQTKEVKGLVLKTCFVKKV